jgi:hypothetical protein
MIVKKYNITSDDFKIIETVILKTEPHKAGQQWKFTGAFYYGTTFIIYTQNELFINIFCPCSIDCSHNNRLWSFYAQHNRWKVVHNVLRDDWHPIRSCHVPEHWRACQQTE